MEDYYQEHDKPNLLYELIGQQIYKLASLGATDEELHVFLAKAGNVTLHDIAVIEAKHLKPKTMPMFCCESIFGEDEE